MSTLKVINLQHPSSSNTVTLDANSNMTIAGTAINPYQGMKNRIINGDAIIDQRNAGASTSAVNGVCGLDRWHSSASLTSKFTVQQTAGSVTPPAGFTSYIGATSSSSYTLGSTDYFGFMQLIEGYNVRDLAYGSSSAKTVTLSFWVRASIPGTYTACLLSGTATKSCISPYTINSANTWQYVSVTFPGDIATSLNSTTTGVGIYVYFSFGAGSSLITSSYSSWLSGTYFGGTGQTSMVGTNGATFYITGVQLEVGSIATAFERRFYSTEMDLCQRYYVDFKDTYNGMGMTSATIGVMRYVITLPVQMRIGPTLTYTNVSAGYSAYSLGGSANYQRINTECAASARADFRPEIDIKADAEF